jgi:transposase
MTTPNDPKSEALRRHGALHPHPADVKDDLFSESDFFDPRDIVLVKYEMLRRVSVDGLPITQVAKTFGFSRPAFYHAQTAFKNSGLPGLIPRRPGPRHAHKLSEEVMDFIYQQVKANRSLRAPALARMVLSCFGISVHPRSIERALKRLLKKGL